MKYNRVRIKRAEFDRLTQDEQCLFVLCCHLLHRSHILSCAILASKSSSTNDDVRSATACQASLLLKVHCGFLFEGWYALRGLYFQTELEKTWAPRLPSEGKAAAEKLRQYFHRHSSVGAIRNHHGFHTDIPTLKRGIALFDKADDLDILVPTEDGPSLCPVAEHLTNASLFDFLESERQQDFVTWVRDELFEQVISPMDDFCHNMAATIAQHCGAERATTDVDVPSTHKSHLNRSCFVAHRRIV